MGEATVLPGRLEDDRTSLPHTKHTTLGRDMTWPACQRQQLGVTRSVSVCGEFIPTSRSSSSVQPKNCFDTLFTLLDTLQPGQADRGQFLYNPFNTLLLLIIVYTFLNPGIYQ